MASIYLSVLCDSFITTLPPCKGMNWVSDDMLPIFPRDLVNLGLTVWSCKFNFNCWIYVISSSYTRAFLQPERVTVTGATIIKNQQIIFDDSELMICWGYVMENCSMTESQDIVQNLVLFVCWNVAGALWLLQGRDLLYYSAVNAIKHNKR